MSFRNTGEKLKMENSKNSEAMTVLKNVWDGAMGVNPFSEPRLKETMHDAMALVINAGLKFDKDDCLKLHDNFHLGSGYYIREYLSADDFYTRAVVVENISACQSIENAVNRKPFITNNVTLPDYHFAGHFDITKKRSRITIGSKFIWKDQRVTVTSFAKDNSYICAVTYKPEKSQSLAQLAIMGVITN